MNELLILYLLTKSKTTMYGLSKILNKNYGMITKPGFGTLQPALKRLEKQGYILSEKYFTDGGKPYFYYSITSKGSEFFRKKMLEKSSVNPTQSIPLTKIKICCSDILDIPEQKELYQTLKKTLLALKFDAENFLNDSKESSNYSHRLVIDGVVCEYNNLLSLVEGLERASNS